jgi:hypothetical protein
MWPFKRNRPKVNSSHHGSPDSRLTWRLDEHRLTDFGVYALSFGAFYVSWGTVYNLALRNGFPSGQAKVVAALSDLAILVYSLKAKQAADEGDRAPLISLAVAVLSGATFAFNIVQAWPHPVGVALHASPPVLWIVGFGFMVESRRRKVLRAKGLLPPKIQHLGFSRYLHAPFSTWRVRKVMAMTGATRDHAMDYLASTHRGGNGKRGNKAVPLAWLRVDPVTGEIIAPRSLAEAPAPRPAVEQAPAPEPAAVPAAPERPALPLRTEARTQVTVEVPQQAEQEAQGDIATDEDRPDIPEELHRALVSVVPPRPEGGRLMKDSVKIGFAMQELCGQHGVKLTGRIMAYYLGVSEPMTVRIRREMRAAA